MWSGRRSAGYQRTSELPVFPASRRFGCRSSSDRPGRHGYAPTLNGVVPRSSASTMCMRAMDIDSTHSADHVNGLSTMPPDSRWQVRRAGATLGGGVGRRVALPRGAIAPTGGVKGHSGAPLCSAPRWAAPSLDPTRGDGGGGPRIGCPGMAPFGADIRSWKESRHGRAGRVRRRDDPAGRGLQSRWPRTENL